MISALSEFQTPFELTIEEVNYTFIIYLDHISEDNLSSNDISGHQIHFNAGRICRFCDVDYSSFKSITSLTNVCIKTNDIYLRDVSNIVQ